MAIQHRKIKRPAGWRLIWFISLVIAIRGIGRIGLVAGNAQQYQLLTHAPPLYIYVLYNFLWSIVFIVVIVGLSGRYAYITHVWWGFSSFAVAELWWNLVFVPDNYDRQRLPFLIFVWVILLALILIVAKRPAFSDFLKGEPHDRSGETINQ